MADTNSPSLIIHFRICFGTSGSVLIACHSHSSFCLSDTSLCADYWKQIRRFRRTVVNKFVIEDQSVPEELAMSPDCSKERAAFILSGQVNHLQLQRCENRPTCFGRPRPPRKESRAWNGKVLAQLPQTSLVCPHDRQRVNRRGSWYWGLCQICWHVPVRVKIGQG